MPSPAEELDTNDIAGNAHNSPAGNSTKLGVSNSTPQTDNEVQASFDSSQPAATEAPTATTPAPTDPNQPNTYGGNFGNDVQGSYNDPNRTSNQRADANRGEFGQQQYNQGSTHGGYGNQFREFDTAAERPSAEPTEEKYYGQGASAPGPQHNSYRDYNGRDLAPDQQGSAVRDTAPANQLGPDGTATSYIAPGDTRNLPSRGGEAAAFQNDNSSPTTGGGYAADYGHTSGVGLPADTPDNYHPTTPGSQNQQPGQPSPRGGYDSRVTHAETTTPGAPAPVDSPDAPQTEGYGYGHERSEEAQPGNPKTGDSRNGFGPGGSQEGNASQGHGSKGGSYDDQNPGARGADYDQFTSQDKAKNYGQGQRDDYRPDDKEPEADHGAPKLNTGRDEE